MGLGELDKKMSKGLEKYTGFTYDNTYFTIHVMYQNFDRISLGSNQRPPTRIMLAEITRRLYAICSSKHPLINAYLAN